jgi:uncharacterized protein (UPF0212 family)
MSSLHKVCPECGLSIDMGLARCPHCGKQVGTVFSETDVAPRPGPSRRSQKAAKEISAYHAVEKAQERANNAVALGLGSFFCPGIGFIMGSISILFGVLATRTLKQHMVEEGRGSATAGIVIGVIALIAQVCYLIYVINMGVPFFG